MNKACKSVFFTNKVPDVALKIHYISHVYCTMSESSKDTESKTLCFNDLLCSK